MDVNSHPSLISIRNCAFIEWRTSRTPQIYGLLKLKLFRTTKKVTEYIISALLPHSHFESFTFSIRDVSLVGQVIDFNVKVLSTYFY